RPAISECWRISDARPVPSGSDPRYRGQLFFFGALLLIAEDVQPPTDREQPHNGHIGFRGQLVQLLGREERCEILIAGAAPDKQGSLIKPFIFSLICLSQWPLEGPPLGRTQPAHADSAAPLGTIHVLECDIFGRENLIASKQAHSSTPRRERR